MVIDELTNNVAKNAQLWWDAAKEEAGAFSALVTDEMSATEKAGKCKLEWENVTFA